MIEIKTKDEIEAMRVGGKILAEVLFQILKNVKSGVSELELDKLAEDLIRKKGAEPAFKRVKGYHHTICVSTNDIVVHGIPTQYTFKEGDVIGVDCGVCYQGFYTDMAHTLRVRNQKSKIKNQKDDIDRFLEVGKKALEEAIKVARVGNRVGHISKTIQNMVEEAGLSVVRSLVGHGVGRKLHEDPEVPGFLSQPLEDSPLLKEGMTIAIEVIYNMVKPDVIYGDDGWTIKTKDGSLSGLFERTVAITDKGPIVLTS